MYKQVASFLKLANVLTCPSAKGYTVTTIALWNAHSREKAHLPQYKPEAKEENDREKAHLPQYKPKVEEEIDGEKAHLPQYKPKAEEEIDREKTHLPQYKPKAEEEDDREDGEDAGKGDTEEHAQLLLLGWVRGGAGAVERSGVRWDSESNPSTSSHDTINPIHVPYRKQLNPIHPTWNSLKKQKPCTEVQRLVLKPPYKIP